MFSLSNLILIYHNVLAWISPISIGKWSHPTYRSQPKKRNRYTKFFVLTLKKKKKFKRTRFYTRLRQLITLQTNLAYPEKEFFSQNIYHTYPKTQLLKWKQFSLEKLTNLLELSLTKILQTKTFHIWKTNSFYLCKKVKAIHFRCIFSTALQLLCQENLLNWESKEPVFLCWLEVASAQPFFDLL